MHNQTQPNTGSEPTALSARRERGYSMRWVLRLRLYFSRAALQNPSPAYSYTVIGLGALSGALLNLMNDNFLFCVLFDHSLFHNFNGGFIIRNNYVRMYAVEHRYTRGDGVILIFEKSARIKPREGCVMRTSPGVSLRCVPLADDRRHTPINNQFAHPRLTHSQ